MSLRKWFDWHSIHAHLFAPIWLRIPERLRWKIASWLNSSPRQCWCDLVDAALYYPEEDPCDIHLPLPTRKAFYCQTECSWSHPEHTGRHECACYCGKFEFMTREGAIDRRARGVA